jgi:hypothetical protein
MLALLVARKTHAATEIRASSYGNWLRQRAHRPPQRVDSSTASIMVRHTCRLSLSDEQRSDLNYQLHAQGAAAAQPAATAATRH